MHVGQMPEGKRHSVKASIEAHNGCYDVGAMLAQLSSLPVGARTAPKVRRRTWDLDRVRELCVPASRDSGATKISICRAIFRGAVVSVV